MKTFDKDSPETSFGAFKPVGNLVITFNKLEDASNAQDDLKIGGYDESELSCIKGAEFIEILDDLETQQSLLAVLGSELKKMDQLYKEAEKGASFLVAFAPSTSEAERVMRVVERYKYKFALKYGHMIIERFDAEHPVSS